MECGKVDQCWFRKLSKIDNDDLVNLLQYYALLEELIKANGQVQI